MQRSWDLSGGGGQLYRTQYSTDPYFYRPQKDEWQIGLETNWDSEINDGRNYANHFFERRAKESVNLKL